MKKKLMFVFVLFVSINVTAQNHSKLSSQFQEKLNEAKMTFIKPDGTTELPVVSNSEMHYDYALKFDDKNIEVRYSIWPIKKAMFDTYNNRQKSAGDSILEPNKFYKQIAIYAFSKISGGKLNPNQVILHPFSSAVIKKEANADAGGMFMGPVDNVFSSKYTFGFYNVIHKDNAGDGFILYLFENQDALFKEYRSITGNSDLFNALKFSN